MSEKEIIKEKNSDEELFDETLDEILEDEDEEGEIEEVEEVSIKDSRLNQILANPWKNVSLDQRNEISNVSLESNFQKQSFNEEPKEQINYNSISIGEDKKKYQSEIGEREFLDKTISEEEKTLNEQRRLYETPHNLRPEIRKTQSSEREFIRSEDMVKKDYLSKKKFF